jgi:hypothetical protein
MGALFLANLALLATYFLSEFYVHVFFYGSITWHLVGCYALLLTFKELFWRKRDT